MIVGTFAITLPAALRLANAHPLDIAVASERLQIALAQQQRANVLWLPAITLGADYAPARRAHPGTLSGCYHDESQFRPDGRGSDGCGAVG